MVLSALSHDCMFIKNHADFLMPPKLVLTEGMAAIKDGVWYLYTIMSMGPFY